MRETTRKVRIRRAILTIVGVGVALVFVRSPSFAALTKSTAPFVPDDLDARVRAEPGAEPLGHALASVLDSAEAVVAGALGGPFRKPFEVLACASQRSLNEFVAIPATLPIRGTVRLGKVFIAPSAFEWEGLDTHRESLVHELVHLYVRQSFGFIAYRKNVPAWFHEGLADLIAGSGGEGITEEEAASAILAGPALRPDAEGSLFAARGLASYGLPGPMLHKQGRMFLVWLRERDPARFDDFVAAFLRRKTFDAPFREHFGAGVVETWEDFKAGLRGAR